MRSPLRLLVLCAALASSIAAAAKRPPTPWYLPRGVFTGIYFSEGAVVPQGRLQWQWILLRQPRDGLIFAFEGGGGWGLMLPGNLGVGGDVQMGSFYEHVLLAGLAYRANYSSGLHWGFQILTGPLFYGAHFDTAPVERRLGGIVEGRARIGLRIGEVRAGISLGVGNIYNEPVRTLSWRQTGGFLGGIFVDWL